MSKIPGLLPDEPGWQLKMEPLVFRSMIGGQAVLFVLWNAFSGLAAAADEPHCPIALDQIKVDKSLIVHDASIISKADFSFSQTIGHILKSLNLKDDPDNQQKMVKSMLASFNAQEHVNPLSGLRMKVDKRPVEALLSASGMLDPIAGMKPVALVNRLDLAPADWNNCGEYRIVYVGGIGPTSLIFEASLKNPHPEMGGEGCRPVAEFWRNLSDKTDAHQIAQDLASFYYQGLNAEFGPIVKAQNYGMPLGQVRSNSDKDGLWQLREWKVVPFGVAGASFSPVTVKSNPLVELYSDNSSGALDPVKQEQVRTAFHVDFVNHHVSELLIPDLTLPNVDLNDPVAVAKYSRELLNTFGATIHDEFNEFQSTQDASDDPTLLMNSIRPAIAAKIATLGLSADRMIGHVEFAKRARAISCSGCHLSAYGGSEIGRLGTNPIKWPSSFEFLHIKANGDLSPALQETFLPFRKEKLFDFICTAAPFDRTSVQKKGPGEEQEYELLLTSLIAAQGNASESDRKRFSALTQLLQHIELEKYGHFVKYRRPH